MYKHKSDSKWFMALLLAVSLAGCADKNTTGPAAPTVTSTNPANAATGTAINTKVAATFNEPMDAATATASTFTVTGPQVSPVAGTVTYTGLTATFTPSSELAKDTAYTGTITTGAQNAAGVPIAANYTWVFTTGLTADTTAPTVISTGAANGATGLPINRNSTVTFSEPMDPVTINSPATTYTINETVSGNAVSGTVTHLDATSTFNPASNLTPNTQYTSTITTAAKDLAGNALAANFVWSWTTGSGLDSTSPTITLTNPANLGTNVPLDKRVSATFSEPMEPSTMVTTNYTLEEKASGNNVSGTVSYNSLLNIATFTPQNLLTPNTTYVAFVTTGAEDLAGNQLIAGQVPNSWEFTTAAAQAQPLAVNLRGAATFGIAAGSGLTSTGITVVNGDIALSPTPTCADATGLPANCAVKSKPASGTGLTVNGSIYFAADPFDNGLTANAVKNDLTLAWQEGRNKAVTQPTIAGDQLSSPIPYVPGVYSNANLGLAAGGKATLDASGDPNAVWVFKVGGDFTDSGTTLLPSEIELINGAQARNVWFIVERDAVIGDGTIWKGNVLAGRDFTVNIGATMLGRALSGAAPGGAGAISLKDGATITVPQ